MTPPAPPSSTSSPSASPDSRFGATAIAPPDPALAAAAETLAPSGGTPGAAGAKRGKRRVSVARAARGSRRKRGAAGVWLVLSLLVTLLAASLGALVVTGKPVAMPDWVVAEVEARLNRAAGFAEAGFAPVGGSKAAGQSLSLGGIEIALGLEGDPALRLVDVQILHGEGGARLAALPELRVGFDAASALRGRLLPRRLQVAGAEVRLTRDAQGRFDLGFAGAGTGGLSAGLQGKGIAGLLDALEGVTTLPIFARLEEIEAEALSLRLTDAAAGRVWQFGDGRLSIANRADALAGELSLSLQRPDGSAMQARISGASAKGTQAAELTAAVDGVEARDLALAAAPLGILAVLDAPLSGQIAARLGAEGQLAGLSGGLEIGPGALAPSAGAKPLGFDAAGLSFAFDPQAERLRFDRISVESATLRLKAFGHVDMPGVVGAGVVGETGAGAASQTLPPTLPQTLTAQITVDDLAADPEGLFTEPAHFSDGALDLRVRLAPFAIEIGQAVLIEGERRLQVKGQASAAAEGWNLGLDIGLNRIDHDRLLALWPPALVPKTREWLAENVLDGTLSDVSAAVRLRPGAAPVFSLGYGFSGTDVRFLKTLPPIQEGFGHASIEGNAYVMVLDRGRVTPPVGGAIDMAGSVFSVLDILAKPAQAEVMLRTRSSVTAALSLLDEEPFRFLTKAGRGVELGQGEAQLTTVLRLPLIKNVPVEAVSFTVEGEVRDFSSDTLVKGRKLVAERLVVSGDPRALVVSGQARLDHAAFEGAWRLGLRREDKGASTLSGTVAITPEVVGDYAPGVAPMLKGSTSGQLEIAFAKGAPPDLVLESALEGLRLTIPPLGHDKAPGTRGAFRLTASLDARPKITGLSLDLPGLSAKADVTLTTDGGLAEARFADLRAGEWLDADVVLTGRGKGQEPGVAVTGGSLDLRYLPKFGVSAGSGPLQVTLDRVQATSTIGLTDLRGTFSAKGGFNGKFSARMNGQGAVLGTVVPSAHGPALRLRSDNAGGVLAGAGIFAHARGGMLDLTLLPQPGAGRWRGTVTAGNFRVVNAPVLAELLSAISVVGLLDQLQGGGLSFTEAEADFSVTPEGIELRRGSAIGAAMGVTLGGTWAAANGALDMQGVISPIYLLNGVGEVLTRRGEGVFGFNYRLQGQADAPQVRVNPLSILTPGMFRDLFRRPVPKLGDG